MTEIIDKRANMIDGIPSSFNVQFVLRSGKKCELCNKRIKKEDIAKQVIIYTDELEFVHKPCLVQKEIFYQHLKEHDLSSPVKLKFSDGRPYKIKEKEPKVKNTHTANNEHKGH